ncbi:MAG: BamA/TamA family outer membrane protein [Planctomycetes bacterium]|nr:BamA/TamA family outer membrane protein [Planctomycetota bacterium]
MERASFRFVRVGVGILWSALALPAQGGQPSPQPTTQQPTMQPPATQPPTTQQPSGQMPGNRPAGGEPPEGEQTQDPIRGVQGGEIHLSEDVQRLQGKNVRAIRIAKQPAGEGASPQLVDQATADSLVRSLETRVGRPFEARKVTADCENLWLERRLLVDASAIEIDGEVVLTFLVRREIGVYERIEFKGLDNLPRATVDSLLGIDGDRQVTTNEAEAMRKVLLSRYHRDGYAFCSIELRERPVVGGVVAADDPEGQSGGRVLEFRIDESKKVTVRDVFVYGNESFAAEPAFGFAGTGSYLLRDSHIQSDPSWGFARGAAYSREVLEEDLDRLRLFYRSRGFLDATVDLADVVFSDDRTEVDVTLVIVEGPRYRIRSVAIEHINSTGQPLESEPLYPAAEIQAELQVEPGEYYDHTRLQRDWLDIQEFYGERGHPPRSFRGMGGDTTACTVSWPPREIYGEGPEVDVTFLVYEGVPKTLRDVVIRGNQFTRDAVIRRRVRAQPGERIDMRDVQLSLRYLEQTRFFTDQYALRGPTVGFEPVSGKPDLLDLAIDVEDGQTGELRWGIGISTGQGAQASISYSKRNFDLWNPPSSWNPVTAFSEMLDNRAFHGGGQQLSVLLAPGSRYSQFRISWLEPDLFGDHYDTWDLRVAGQRLISRQPDGYTSDTLGGEIGIGRSLTDNFNIGVAARHDTVEIGDLAGDATKFAYDAEGSSELRGIRLTARYRDLDDLRRPTEGVDLALSGEVVGGFLGGDVDIYKFVHTADAYTWLWENEMEHRTVLHFDHFFGVAHAFGNTRDVFLTERFFLGGRNLRGFDYRNAGPSQFGRPLGGEAIYSSSLELTFPLVATRLENEVRDRELLRFAMFTDFGLLGLGIDDPTFGEVRLSSGVGLRIEIPYLEVPIALDVAWPWLYEQSDDRRQFFFWISR